MTAGTIEKIFENAALSHTEGRPFVLYAKPLQQHVTAVFQQDDKTHVAQNLEVSGFVFASFDGERKFVIPDIEAEIFSASISGQPEKSNEIEATLPDEHAKNRFVALVEKGVAAIRSGELGKVVLSRTEAVGIEEDFIGIFRRLLLAYPTAFRYCWFHPQTGIWMGATPEQLLKTTNRGFSTVALAGTQPFVDTEHVLWQEKEKTEQQFVTDFISDGLREIASNLNLSEPYTTRAGNLLHIKTDITGEFNHSSGLGEAIGILHPTPAVCGYPKAAAKKFIAEHEGYDREFYSGFLGEIGDATSDLYVNLRCMKLTGTSANLYIGCGITKDSDPASEFIETANKALTMKKILS